ncbi:MAG TPA: RloB family protein [Streptosporangiaceae bacterium]|jgi:hypothetical protein
MRRPYRPRQRKKRFLLYCEGDVTEPEYFNDLRRHFRNPLIEIEIGEGKRNDPKGLVELAKERREEARRGARRQRDDSLLYDEVWCIFDVDKHANLYNAIQQAKDISISLAVSNPCFELWILLHFKEQWASITGQKSLSAVRGHLKDYEKRADFEKLKGKGEVAMARAKKMEARARANDEEFANPTTGVWHLVATLCHEAEFPTDKV